MRKAAAVAFAPAHITGFFEICDSPKDPLEKGSRGAGISLSKGVFTRVRLTPDRGGVSIEGFEKSALRHSKPQQNPFEGLASHTQLVYSKPSITINGKPSKAPVSRAVLRHLANKGFAWSGKLKVDHKIQVPMGSGFGTSGAGALSLALAMNSLLGNKLTKTEAARIAHLAEIECKTGLGTVIGEFVGGFEVRTKPGAPGTGRVVKLPIDPDLEVLCIWFGPVSKPTALSSRNFRKAVNKAGRGRVKKMLKNSTTEKFMELSRNFAESLPGPITPRMRRVLDECDAAKIPCSVMMIGRSLFALSRNGREKRILLGIFRKHAGPRGRIIVAKAEPRGARILRWSGPLKTQ